MFATLYYGILPYVVSRVDNISRFVMHIVNGDRATGLAESMYGLPYSPRRQNTVVMKSPVLVTL